MQIAVTGSSGMIGRRVVSVLEADGHRVTRLVRRAPGEGELQWDPQGGVSGLQALSGIDGVVHLAGENIAARRWTAAFKQRVRDSRVLGTRQLCEALVRLVPLPQFLVCASAVGFYGNRGDQILDEQSPRGEGFLAETCEEWERASDAALDGGIRVVRLRFGMVLDARDGALAKMLTPFRLGVGGVVGSGRQYWSWIALDDAAGAVQHAIATPGLAGAVNAVSPGAVTNVEFTRALGNALRRPTVFPVPAFAARLAFGEMADELLLSSARVEPRRLIETGYRFAHPTIEDALSKLLA